jgi:hypothetical protein
MSERKLDPADFRFENLTGRKGDKALWKLPGTLLAVQFITTCSCMSNGNNVMGLGSINGIEFSIERLEDCDVYLLDHVGQVRTCTQQLSSNGLSILLLSYVE